MIFFARYRSLVMFSLHFHLKRSSQQLKALKRPGNDRIKPSTLMVSKKQGSNQILIFPNTLSEGYLKS